MTVCALADCVPCGAASSKAFIDLSGTERLLGDPVDSSLRLRKVLRDRTRKRTWNRADLD